jgi:hypothetical protein
MFPKLIALPALAAVALSAGCSSANSGNWGCGISAVAGQSLILEEFTRPGKTLSVPPAQLPAALPVRIALGPVYRSIVGRADSLMVVGMQDTLPTTPLVGFGVLIVTPEGKADGVLLYNGDPIQGAPRLGSVHAGDRVLPMIGLQTSIKNFEDPSCPVFPDSLRR